MIDIVINSNAYIIEGTLAINITGEDIVDISVESVDFLL